MEVEYKMGHLLKVYYDGHTSGLYWPIDVVMTPGILGFNILSKSPRNLSGGFQHHFKSGDKVAEVNNSRLRFETQCK